MSFRRIAVAIDFSTSARHAFRRARRIVEPGGEIVLIHIVDSAIFARGPAFGDAATLQSLSADLLRGAKLQLDTLAEEARSQGARIEVLVRAGRPADEVLAAAASCDLLCLGTHARSILGRLLLGSTSEEVARRSPIPVLVVRDEDEPVTKRVLLALDPTGPARDAVRVGAELARRLDAALEAIHAVFLPTVLPYAEDSALLKITKVLEAHLAFAPAAVKRLVETTTGMKDVKVHVVSGSPASEIAHWANPSDILVCGTHGRNAVGRLVFGSVAAKLLRSAPCPVLVVRPAEDEAPG